MIGVAKRDGEEVTSVTVRSPEHRSRALRLSRRDTRQDRECPNCGAIKRVGNARCSACKGYHITDGEVSAHKPFAEDASAVAFVDENVGGATLEQVGQALGVTRERVRQIEMVALRKLREALLDEGVSARDVGDLLTQRAPAGEHIPSGRFVPEHDRAQERVRLLAEEREAALAEPSDWLRALNDSLDEVIAVGEFVCLAADYAEHEGR